MTALASALPTLAARYAKDQFKRNSRDELSIEAGPQRSLLLRAAAVASLSVHVGRTLFWQAQGEVPPALRRQRLSLAALACLAGVGSWSSASPGC